MEKQGVTIDEYGFKTTPKGTKYCIYHFMDPKKTLKQSYDGLIKDYSGKQSRNTCVSLSYNNNGKYETTPFLDSSVGVIISGNYNINGMYKRNIVSGGNNPELDENKRIIRDSDYS